MATMSTADGVERARSTIEDESDYNQDIDRIRRSEYPMLHGILSCCCFPVVANRLT